MLEMMEHFRDQYSAMQRMIEVITEADRGKALALQRLLAQPLFTQKTPDGAVVEERVLELEKKVSLPLLLGEIPANITFLVPFGHGITV